MWSRFWLVNSESPQNRLLYIIDNEKLRALMSLYFGKIKKSEKSLEVSNIMAKRQVHVLVYKPKSK